MRVRMTRHGTERLFERVYKKASKKNESCAENFISKIIERGKTMVDDAEQMMIYYAQNLYFFKKEGCDTVAFITVKTNNEYNQNIYLGGKKQKLSTRKNFQCCC